MPFRARPEMGDSPGQQRCSVVRHGVHPRAAGTASRGRHDSTSGTHAWPLRCRGRYGQWMGSPLRRCVLPEARAGEEVPIGVRGFRRMAHLNLPRAKRWWSKSTARWRRAEAKSRPSRPTTDPSTSGSSDMTSTNTMQPRRRTTVDPADKNVKGANTRDEDASTDAPGKNRDTITMTAKIRVQVPRSVLVVVDFDGSVRTAIEDDGSPFHYDLEADECFVRYLVDQGAQPIVRARSRRTEAEG